MKSTIGWFPIVGDRNVLVVRSGDSIQKYRFEVSDRDISGIFKLPYLELSRLVLIGLQKNPYFETVPLKAQAPQVH